MHEAGPSSRFAADVDYSGRAGRHDYVVHARHRLLDTTFTVMIDGVEHDPKAEETARAAREGTEKGLAADAGGAEDAETDGDQETSGDSDDLRFTLADGFTTLRCTVRRPREDEDHKDAEVITLRTAGLGGAGEVEIRHGFQRTVLVPAEGSPSAARDAKRTAHPTRYALVAALTKSVRYLLPLFGLGALFSGLLDPLSEWVEERVRPVVEAIARATAPPREWIGQLLQPVRDFLAFLLRPLRDLVDWLLGLLPDIAVPFDVPGWVVDVLIAVIVVVAVFSATRRGLRVRREKLAETRAAGSEDPDDVPHEDLHGTDPGAASPHPRRRSAEPDPSEPSVADQQLSES